MCVCKWVCEGILICFMDPYIKLLVNDTAYSCMFNASSWHQCIIYLYSPVWHTLTLSLFLFSTSCADLSLVNQKMQTLHFFGRDYATFCFVQCIKEACNNINKSKEINPTKAKQKNKKTKKNKKNDISQFTGLYILFTFACSCALDSINPLSRVLPVDTYAIHKLEMNVLCVYF